MRTTEYLLPKSQKESGRVYKVVSLESWSPYKVRTLLTQMTVETIGCV